MSTSQTTASSVAESIKSTASSIVSSAVASASGNATSGGNATHTSTVSKNTIAPYATALNGVNQIRNSQLRDTLWWMLSVLAMIIFTIRMIQKGAAHFRHIHAMRLSGEQQKYWSINKSAWNWKFKKYIMYAPLGKKRHNREIRLSKAGNIGTIPSRFHFILLVIYILTNIAFMLVLDYNRDNKYSIVAELRGRAGVLAVINMIPLVIFASRNNPFIALLKISFDTYNLMHRWLGRTSVFMIIVHMSCWGYVKHAAAGWAGMKEMIFHDQFIGWGTVGACCMLVIVFQTLSPVRHAFYETFLNIHIIMAFTIFVATWIHCVVADLPQVPIIQSIFFLWVTERICRMITLLYSNYAFRGRHWTQATILALPGEACRVTMHLPKHIDVKPGSHAYVRFAGIRPWESHPFSIAWIEHKPLNPALPTSENEKVVFNPLDETVTDLSFVIGAHSGFTRKLYDKANACSPNPLYVKAAFEGPYGGHHSLDSYGHAVLFAGSSGITHQIPFLRYLINGYNNHTVATRKVVLIWIVRDAEHLEWIRPWMDIILKIPNRKDILTIKLFITKPKNPKEIQSPSSTVQMFPGRPNVPLLLQTEVKDQQGAMCVTVCGPGGLADNVREAVRSVQHAGMVDFIEESFTW